MDKEQVKLTILQLEQEIRALEAAGLQMSDKGGNAGKCGEHIFLAGKELEKAIEFLKKELVGQ